MADMAFATVRTTARTVAYANVLVVGLIGQGLPLRSVGVTVEPYVVGLGMLPVPVSGNVVVAGRSSLSVTPVITDVG